MNDNQGNGVKNLNKADKNFEKKIENAKIDAGKIKMTVNDPALKGKITSKITDPDGTVYWYIRFNTPLDPDTVTKHTMNVTETNGYIMNVIITYDSTRNLIVLNPMDLYRQNEYYILSVSTKVKSNKGRPLSKPVHIMFKIVGDQISEFQVLKDGVKVPKPRKKPASVRRAEIRELMTEQAHEEDPVKKVVGMPSLPFGRLSVKVQLAVLGLVWLALSLFFNNFFVTLLGIGLLLLGLIHICIQLSKRQTRSAIFYDLGVRRFNAGDYQAADVHFKKSYELNPRNELAEHALEKNAKILGKGR